MVKQGTGVSTDWKKSLHQLQEKVNKLTEDKDILKAEIIILKNIRCRLKNLCRKMGWVLLTISLCMCLFDFIAAYLHGTQFSFRYQVGFGFNQIFAIAITSALGWILIITGYKGKK